MSANRAKDTKPELLLRQALWQSGHRGYRLHYRIKTTPPSNVGNTRKAALRRKDSKSSPPSKGGVDAASADGVVGGVRTAAQRTSKITSTRPDITFVGKKVAIFVHGCFWHRCPKCALHPPQEQLRLLASQIRPQLNSRIRTIPPNDQFRTMRQVAFKKTVPQQTSKNSGEVAARISGREGSKKFEETGN